MKIALLNMHFDEYSIQLANGLAKYVDLTLVQPEKQTAICKDKNLIDGRINLVRFKKPRIRDPRNLFAMSKMMQIIREANPDVLHVQETNDIWYDLTLSINKMPPLVTTIHDVFRHPGDRDLIPGSEYTRRIAFYRSQQLIVHANVLKDVLNKEFNLPSERISVVPHGELGSLFKYFAGNQVLPREPYTLLFFGRIWPYKGLRYLLEALPLVAKQIPEVKLIIAGRGENVSELLDEENKKRCEILTGFIPFESVAGLFQRSTVTVLPYIESSQSGVAVIAYSLGTPVIASDIGGLSEMIRHEQDGLLVPPRDVPALANTIIRLLSDSNLQQKITLAAMERCQQDLNWSNIAAQTVEVYRRAATQKNSRIG